VTRYSNRFSRQGTRTASAADVKEIYATPSYIPGIRPHVHERAQQNSSRPQPETQPPSLAHHDNRRLHISSAHLPADRRK
jgi:hypothetical protein